MEIWSIGTALRNPNRIPKFMNILSKFDGCFWNDQTQLDYYIELIRKGEVEPKKIISSQLNVSQNQARKIMYNNYRDAPIRGRVLGSLLCKLDFIDLSQYKVKFTNIGTEIVNQTIPLNDALIDGLTKWQYISSVSQWSSFLKTQLITQNFSPFVAILYLIGRVNRISGNKSGITYQEYNFFAKTLDNYDLVNYFACLIVFSRLNKHYRAVFMSYVRKRCNNFRNTDDYSDNDIKYFTATGLVSSSGQNNSFANIDYSNLKRIKFIVKNNIPDSLSI